MESTFDKKNDRVYSKIVQAGKRTYFFDVKSTRRGDYYLTITESRRKYKTEESDGQFFLKTRLFLYKEDFEKFNNALREVTDYIRKERGIPENPVEGEATKSSEGEIPKADTGHFTDISFDDLGERK